MDGIKPGYQALKTWEKDGKWGVAVSEELVPAFDMTRAQALEAIDAYYKLGGKTEQQHTDDFHEFYANRRDLAEKHLAQAEEDAAKDSGPRSQISRSENPNAETR